MISCGCGFGDPAPSVRLQARQQNRALDLCARHVRNEVDAVECPADDGQRRPVAAAASIVAPIRERGAMIRRIGRRDRSGRRSAWP